MQALFRKRGKTIDGTRLRETLKAILGIETSNFFSEIMEWIFAVPYAPIVHGSVVEVVVLTPIAQRRGMDIRNTFLGK